MKTDPKVGIIIVTYNSEGYIQRCIKSVAQQKYQNYSLYIVDNNSTDTTRSLVQAGGVGKLLAQPVNTGYAGGNNIGIHEAFADGCDVVFLLNPDAFVEAETITRLVESHEKAPSAGALQPLILLHPDHRKVNSSGNCIQYLGFGFTRDYRKDVQNILPLTDAEHSIPYASGAAVLYTKEALEKVGMLDETFFLYHEDLDLSWRMRMCGFDIRIVPEARAFHEYNFSKSIQKFYFMERNRFLFLLKNFSIHYLIAIAPMFFITEFGLLLFSLKNGFFMERVKAWMYFLNIKNSIAVIRARQDVQKRRVIDDTTLKKYLRATISFQDIDSTLLARVGNPLFSLYFKLIYPFI